MKQNESPTAIIEVPFNRTQFENVWIKKILLNFERISGESSRSRNTQENFIPAKILETQIYSKLCNSRIDLKNILLFESLIIGKGKSNKLGHNIMQHVYSVRTYKQLSNTDLHSIQIVHQRHSPSHSSKNNIEYRIAIIVQSMTLFTLCFIILKDKKTYETRKLEDNNMLIFLSHFLN